MMLLFLLICATIFLAYSNGANDNFKGVATLFGSRTTNYKSALWLATGSTFAGSACSIFLADTLVKNFSGKGLVPLDVANSPEFLLAVSLGAGLTVILATLTGFPISTTHSLIGALVGGGLVAVGTEVNFATLQNSFFLPLLLSPVLAIALASSGYFALRSIRIRSGITRKDCLCLNKIIPIVAEPNYVISLQSNHLFTPKLSIDSSTACSAEYSGRIFGFRFHRVLDVLHYSSAGIVSFARGLNDTPKIVALMLVFKALNLNWGILIIATAMATGGLLNAKKVAIKMSDKITPLNHGQGFTANFITGLIVIFASKLGLPVSTTHVSVGSLFGIGLVTGKANHRVIREILLSWVLTLPVSFFFGGFIFWAIH